MITAEEISAMLAQNVKVIERQTEGLTHADSMLQLPFRGNCLNWVLGHIIVSRDYMLSLANAEPLWDEARSAIYGARSEAMGADAESVDMGEILADLRRSQEHLSAAMAALDEEQLNAQVENLDMSLRARLAFMAWHDSYHTGQTEYLRQLAGVNDKVI